MTKVFVEPDTLGLFTISLCKNCMMIYVSFVRIVINWKIYKKNLTTKNLTQLYQSICPFIFLY